MDLTTTWKLISAVSLLYLSLLFTPFATAQQELLQPHLDGPHFTITVQHTPGFLEIRDNSAGEVEFSGYLVDVIEALARPERANFTYDLVPPSGYGSGCNPIATNELEAYAERYRTQYNCGTSDVNDDDFRSDMYLGMYYVTPSRQLQNQFTIPFLPPSSGALAKFGTATGVSDFEDLLKQQQEGLQQAACAPGGSAIPYFANHSFPGLQVKEFFGGLDEIYEAFEDGTCDIYIVDYPVATQNVLQYSQRGTCTANGNPIGVIGEPMEFGLSHYAIGIRSDIDGTVEQIISYWINYLMACSPLDPEGTCGDGNLASFYEGKGGSGDECDYVQFPQEPHTLSPLAIVGIALASIAFVVSLCFVVYWVQLRRKERITAKRHAEAERQAARERELNEFIANEVRKPLESALFALQLVSTKADDATYIPLPGHQTSILQDLKTIDSNLECVSALIEGLVAEDTMPEMPTLAPPKLMNRRDSNDISMDLPGVSNH